MTRPLSPVEIEEIKRKPRLTSFERRAIATIEVLLGELASKEKTEEPLKVVEAEAAFETREKVLVVIEFDGMTEIYAHKWIDVKVVELEPWDDPTFIEGLPPQYAELHYANLCRAMGVAKMRKRPEIDEVLRRYAVFEGRMEAAENLKSLIEGLKQQAGADR